MEKGEYLKKDVVDNIVNVVEKVNKIIEKYF